MVKKWIGWERSNHGLYKIDRGLSYQHLQKILRNASTNQSKQAVFRRIGYSYHKYYRDALPLKLISSVPGSGSDPTLFWTQDELRTAKLDRLGSDEYSRRLIWRESDRFWLGLYHTYAIGLQAVSCIHNFPSYKLNVSCAIGTTIRLLDIWTFRSYVLLALTRHRYLHPTFLAVREDYNDIIIFLLFFFTSWHRQWNLFPLHILNPSSLVSAFVWFIPYKLFWIFFHNEGFCVPQAYLREKP
jgi:hypothetical protein